MSAQTTPRHRVTVATAQMRDAAASVADASVWSMDATETARTLVEITRLEAQLAAIRSRVAAHAEFVGVGDEIAASSTAAWLAHETKQTRPAAHGTVKLGHELEAHPATRDALATAAVCEDQARAIIRAVDALPDDVDTDLRATAEAHLLAEAQHHDAQALARLGKRLFEVIAPEHADAHEAALLEREEAAAARKTHLRLWDDGHGTTHLRGTLPTLEGTALRKLLHALAARRHRTAVEGAGAESLPTAEAMGQALCELITRYPRKAVAKTGGLNATLVVLIHEDSLMGRVERAGILDTGETISPALARRLACEAGIIPLVLGGDSMPLDVGREHRLHTRYQRIAIHARDRGCRAEGCDRTTGLHTHHDHRWADGGTTTVGDGITLCGWHHARTHDPRYETSTLPNGRVEFHRRT
jgi:uncharacterized protein DUF222